MTSLEFFKNLGYYQIEQLIINDDVKSLLSLVRGLTDAEIGLYIKQVLHLAKGQKRADIEALMLNLLKQEVTQNQHHTNNTLEVISISILIITVLVIISRYL